MNISKVLVPICLLLLPFFTVQASETSEFKLPRIHVAPIKDTQGDRQYELYIKLPEEYAKSKDKTYPVIYFTDALWHIELLSASTEFLMEEAILVGISWQKNLDDERAHFSRFRDYTVKKSNNSERQAKYQFGQAGNHLSFIRNDVIKHVENNYRTNPDNRTYFGYSAGGLFGSYILMAQPDTFKNYILGSPAVNGDIALLSQVGAKAKLRGKGLNANVFISYGALEKELSQHIKEFTNLLKARKDSSLFLHDVVVEGDHQQAFPITGVRGVTWLSNLVSDKG